MSRCDAIAYTSHMNLRAFAYLILLVALSIGAGCSSAPAKAPQPKPHTSKQNADAWALAAVEAMQIRGDAALALANAQRAGQAEPQRADLTWLWISLCLRAQGCSPEQLESRLRSLDPGNGAVWLAPLARAQAEGDTRSEEQILET